MGDFLQWFFGGIGASLPIIIYRIYGQRSRNFFHEHIAPQRPKGRAILICREVEIDDDNFYKCSIKDIRVIRCFVDDFSSIGEQYTPGQKIEDINVYLGKAEYEGETEARPKFRIHSYKKYPAGSNAPFIIEHSETGVFEGPQPKLDCRVSLSTETFVLALRFARSQTPQRIRAGMIRDNEETDITSTLRTEISEDRKLVYLITNKSRVGDVYNISWQPEFAAETL